MATRRTPVALVPRTALAALLIASLWVAGCASGAPERLAAGTPAHAGWQEPRELPAQAAAVAVRQVGAPYRYGGRGPGGFDCSGLVVYSYARVGLAGLPHSAAALERQARPVGLAELAPGDLLFFRPDGEKASHVAIYLGDRTFVHAPSRGRPVETVSFDHVHWGPRIRQAGRLAPSR